MVRRLIKHDVLRSRSALFRGRAGRKIGSALRDLGHTPIADEIDSYRRVAADAALRITVFGEYSVGKSTLINALLGRQVLAARLRPTTGVPTELRDGPDRVTVLFRDGRKQDISFKDVDGYSDLDLQSRADARVDRIIVSTKNPVLEKGIALIDTPGLLDNDRQTERARVEVAGADVVMLVLRADHLLSDVEQSLALDWLTEDLGKPVVPVLNFLGRIEASGRADLRRRLESFTCHLKQPFEKPAYEIDALPALRHCLDINGACAPNDDYDALRAELRGLTASQIKSLKRQSRADWRASWATRAKQINSLVRCELEDEGRQFASERQQQIQAINATIERLGGNRKGDHARCIALVKEHKSGGRRAVIKALPGNLSTEEQRSAAVGAMAGALERALRTIDEGANKILMAAAADAGLIPELVSVRELIALDVPADSGIRNAESEARFAGLGWAAFAGLAAAVAVSWPLAIPAAIIGLVYGTSTSDVAKQLAEFRQKFSDATDSQLDKAGRLLGAAFDARIDELIAALRKRAGSIDAMPPRAKELMLRRELDELLA
jgi:hypothetical protein